MSVFDLLNAIGAHDHGRAIRILARNVEKWEAPQRTSGALITAVSATVGIERSKMKAGGA